jgi:hypothetical protein
MLATQLDMHQFVHCFSKNEGGTKLIFRTKKMVEKELRSKDDWTDKGLNEILVPERIESIESL